MNKIKKTMPRHEHPRPQAVRSAWQNLNGEWEFAETNSVSKKTDEKFLAAKKLDEKILVPFCRESELSGINRKKFVKSVWYKRSFSIPKNWNTKKILIHFGAVDWKTRVWINGNLVGMHIGGQASFSFEITKFLKKRNNKIVVNAYDDTRSGIQASGKQSDKPESYGCLYTGITGIWQTVWLEAVGQTYVPDPENKCAHVETLIKGDTKNIVLNAKLTADKKTVAKAKVKAGTVTRFTIPIKNQEIWSIKKLLIRLNHILVREKLKSKGKRSSLTAKKYSKDLSSIKDFILMEFGPLRAMLFGANTQTGEWTITTKLQNCPR